MENTHTLKNAKFYSGHERGRERERERERERKDERERERERDGGGGGGRLLCVEGAVRGRDLENELKIERESLR